MSGPLPNFLIAGTMKSGTTSLARWLGAHPEVFVPQTKEVHFFDIDQYWELGVDWYREFFRDAGGHAAIGEATPRYVYFDRAVQRMAQTLPDAKLIVCLRDPIGRARSHWTHAYHRSGLEYRPFAQAMRDELAGRGEAEPDALDAGYLSRGHYAFQLERLAQHYPRERIHIVLFDELRAEPEATFSATCRFLGVDPEVVPEIVGARANPAAAYRPLRLWRHFQRHGTLERLPGRVSWWIQKAMYVQLPPAGSIEPALREQLEAYFAPHDARLRVWLGRDPGW